MQIASMVIEQGGKVRTKWVWECCCASFRHSHMQDLRVILQRCLPTGLRLLVRAPKEFVLEEAEEVLAEVVVGAQCGLGEGRAVQVVLRAVVDWK